MCSGPVHFFYDLIKFKKLFKYLWHLFILIRFLPTNSSVDNHCVIEFFD